MDGAGNSPVTSLLERFLAEAADLLEQVDSGLLALERDPHDPERLDEVFRVAHTLKGSSGLFDLPALTGLTHAAEDVLDAVRAGRLELNPALFDDLLAVFDVLRRWIDAISRTGQLPPDAGAVGGQMSVRLRAGLGGDPAPVPAPRLPGDDLEIGAAGQLPPAPAWLLEDLGRERVESLRAWLEHARGTCRVVRYVPGEQCFFSGEDPLHLVSKLPALEMFHTQPREPWPGPESFDEYRCLLVFTVATRATVAELEHLFRYVREEIELAVVGADSLAALLAPPPAPVSAPPSPILAAARAALEAQLRAMTVEIPSNQFAARVASAAAVATSALLALGADTQALPVAVQACLEQSDTAPLVGAIRAGLESTAPVPATGPDPTAPNPTAAPGDPVVDVSRAEAAGPDLSEPAQPRADPGTAGGAQPRAGRPGGRVLKVDQATVDRLLDLVGQLVVAKNGLPFLAAEAEEQWQARALARRIKDQYAVVNRISEELQTAVMDVRMLPMSTAFERFPRLVRDLARTLGKEVELTWSGEETAADKDIIEMLADPLVHLVRNSLDHGIEPPDVRVAAGKSPGARLQLRAAQEPDAVVIDVLDDGRGIDPELVRRRAYERGVIDEEQLAGMTDQDAVNLVFAPGFSTAERVSDVSGRGVGMDAVRASVGAAGGTVRLTSSIGEGTHVQLRMPLSMAVSRVMIVTVRGQRFGVPIDIVTETVRVPPSQVRRIENQAVLVLRDSVIPLIDLARALEIPGEAADPERVSVLAARLDGLEVGLVIDAFHEGAEVIVKPMEGVLTQVGPYSGTALMGDGTVLLVLDVRGVLADAGEGTV